ncbi:MAG: hypothetical protein ACHQSE_04190 [Gemmatimonadales bacterium]
MARREDGVVAEFCVFRIERVAERGRIPEVRERTVASKQLSAKARLGGRFLQQPPAGGHRRGRLVEAQHPLHGEHSELRAVGTHGHDASPRRRGFAGPFHGGQRAGPKHRCDEVERVGSEQIVSDGEHGVGAGAGLGYLLRETRLGERAAGIAGD